MSISHLMTSSHTLLRRDWRRSARRFAAAAAAGGDPAPLLRLEARELPEPSAGQRDRRRSHRAVGS